MDARARTRWDARLHVITRRAPFVEFLGDNARQEPLASRGLAQADGEAERGDDGEHDVADDNRDKLGGAPAGRWLEKAHGVEPRGTNGRYVG